jgi:hypothetical protein
LCESFREPSVPYNKVVYILSKPMINASTILKHNSLAHEIYVEQYDRDDDFKHEYMSLTHGNQ